MTLALRWFFLNTKFWVKFEMKLIINFLRLFDEGQSYYLLLKHMPCMHETWTQSLEGIPSLEISCAIHKALVLDMADPGSISGTHMVLYLPEVIPEQRTRSKIWTLSDVAPKQKTNKKWRDSTMHKALSCHIVNLGLIPDNTYSLPNTTRNDLSPVRYNPPQKKKQEERKSNEKVNNFMDILWTYFLVFVKEMSFFRCFFFFF